MRVEPSTVPDLRVNTTHTLQLTDLATGGEALGRLDGCVVFVERGAPGDLVEVELTEVRKSFARGRIRQVLEPSEMRVPPVCPIYDACGGCQIQHLDYSHQLALKTRLVHDALRLARLGDLPVHPCLPTEPLHYRTKMQLVAGVAPQGKMAMAGVAPQGKTGLAGVAPQGKMGLAGLAPQGKTSKPGKSHPHPSSAPSGEACLGLYARHSHRVIPMDTCYIAHPLANRILEVASSLLRELGWSVYQENSGRGLVRHVLARVSAARDQALVVVVATSERLPQLQRFCSELAARIPEVVGVAVNINTERTNVILGRTTRSVWGQDHLIDEVTLPGDAPALFRTGPTSFFQVNPHGLVRIAQVARDYLGDQRGATVVDAYCGVGSLSILAARHAHKVYGIEIVDEAIQAARLNAELNLLTHADFRVGKTEHVLPALLAEGAKVDAVLLDPPRKGCESMVLETLCKLQVPTIVYVSCNPVTLARDLATLLPQGYRLTDLQPVDMFPQTSHVECVARLVRTSEGPVAAPTS